jgi:hypothetical protein
MPFTDAPWTSPEAALDANDFCEVCLLDLNEPGRPKVKGRCYLPVRKAPGEPINTNAMAAAAAYLGKLKVSPEARRQAARKLKRLYAELKRDAPEMVRRYAGD